MKNERKHAWLFVQVLAVAALLFMAAPRLVAQTTSSGSTGSNGGGTNFSNNPATNFNPPPCDFNNLFYNNVGISTSKAGNTAETAQGVDSPVAQRFGLFRQTGPPAIFPSQVNWKIDNSCTTRDAIRNNVRILATTGGYSDDGTGQPTHFINIMAFLTNQSFFEQNYVNGDPCSEFNVGSGCTPGSSEAVPCVVPTPPALPASGCVVISNAQGDGSVNAGLNARNEPNAFFNGLPGNAGGGGQGDDMQDIVSNFEAYASLRQIVNGVRTFNPCGTMQQPPAGQAPLLPPNCFSVSNVVVNGQTVSSDVATPNLIQDWRFAVNRNAIDGSDNNIVDGTGSTGATKIVNTDGSTGATVFNSPYGYFCDDLLGMWIVTYFWFTEPPNFTTAVAGSQCQGPATFDSNGNLINGAYAFLAAKNGVGLEGWPVVKTPDDLNNSLEGLVGANGQTCGQEGNEDVGGADGGAVWLICPAIADPTNGAIALDAFLDQSRRPNGAPVDPGFTANFFCLQFFGQFCSTLTSAQVSSAQSQGAAAQSAAAAAPAAATSAPTTSD